jgi:plasmid maintenance system killer protein
VVLSVRDKDTHAVWHRRYVKKQYSVRINDQWRPCFTWSTAGAGNVELVDYH